MDKIGKMDKALVIARAKPEAIHARSAIFRLHGGGRFRRPAEVSRNDALSAASGLLRRSAPRNDALSAACGHLSGGAAASSPAAHSTTKQFNN